MQRHAVHDGCHGMFAHTIVDVAAREVITCDEMRAWRLGIDRTCQIRRAADHFRQSFGQYHQRLARCLPCCPADLFIGAALLVCVDGSYPTICQRAGDRAAELSLVHVNGQAPFPLNPLGIAARTCVAPGAQNIVRHHERIVRPAHGVSRQRHFFVAKRRTVGR